MSKFSSRVLGMKFMQRAEEARKVDSLAKENEQAAKAAQWSVKPASDAPEEKVTMVMDESSVIPPYIIGRRSFGGFNQAVEKLESEAQRLRDVSSIKRRVDRDTITDEEMATRMSSTQSSSSSASSKSKNTRGGRHSSSGRYHSQAPPSASRDSGRGGGSGGGGSGGGGRRKANQSQRQPKYSKGPSGGRGFQSGGRGRGRGGGRGAGNSGSGRGRTGGRRGRSGGKRLSPTHPTNENLESMKRSFKKLKATE